MQSSFIVLHTRSAPFQLPYPPCIEPMLRTRGDCKFNGTAVVQGRRHGSKPASCLLTTRRRPTNNTARQDGERARREGRGQGAELDARGQSTAADSFGPVGAA